MADNIAITPGAGATVATDEVGARHFQLVKLALGADGTATLVAIGEQAAAASIPVTLDTEYKLGVATALTQIIKTVAAAATPELIAASETLFKSATIMGYRAARTLNTGNVWLGLAATNDSQPWEIAPGEIIQITAPPGQRYDLNEIYVDVATDGDGVIVWYS